MSAAATQPEEATKPSAEATPLAETNVNASTALVPMFLAAVATAAGGADPSVPNPRSQKPSDAASAAVDADPSVAPRKLSEDLGPDRTTWFESVDPNVFFVPQKILKTLLETCEKSIAICDDKKATFEMLCEALTSMRDAMEQLSPSLPGTQELVLAYERLLSRVSSSAIGLIHKIARDLHSEKIGDIEFDVTYTQYFVPMFELLTWVNEDSYGIEEANIYGLMAIFHPVMHEEMMTELEEMGANDDYEAAASAPVFAPANTQFCRFDNRGCATKGCTFQHKNPRQLCRNIVNGVPCPYGDACRFLHQLPKTSWCESEIVFHGCALANCRSAHFLPRTLCPNLPECQHGDACFYLHDLGSAFEPVERPSLVPGTPEHTKYKALLQAKLAELKAKNASPEDEESYASTDEDSSDEDSDASTDEESYDEDSYDEESDASTDEEDSSDYVTSSDEEDSDEEDMPQCRYEQEHCF